MSDHHPTPAEKIARERADELARIKEDYGRADAANADDPACFAVRRLFRDLENLEAEVCGAMRELRGEPRQIIYDPVGLQSRCQQVFMAGYKAAEALRETEALSLDDEVVASDAVSSRHGHRYSTGYADRAFRATLARRRAIFEAVRVGMLAKEPSQ